MKTIKGKDNIVSQCISYLKDESMLSYGDIQCVAFPENEKEVAQFLVEMSDSEIPVTISNGRTGVTGGAVPLKGALMSLEKINRVLEIKSIAGEWRAVCQAGVSLAELEKEISKYEFPENKKYFYPVDVTETSSRIGGNVATNASGERSFKYGSTRKWIRRIKVVLSSGDILEIERGRVFADDNGKFELTLKDGKVIVQIPFYKMPNVKNAAGYYSAKNMDLIDLFVGSEGTLGVITEVEIALTKRPQNVLTLMSFFENEESARAFFRACRQQLKSTIVYEYLDYGALDILNKKRAREGDNSVVPELPGYAKAAIYLEVEFNEENFGEIAETIENLLKQNGSSMDRTWGGDTEKDIKKIRDIRHALPEGINETITHRKNTYPKIHKISVDAAVPENKLEEMIANYKTVMENFNMEYTVFGHIGESHLHMNILPRNEEEFLKAKELHTEFAKKAVDLGGTVSAEHGIGKIKLPYLEVMYGKEGIKQMVDIKKTLDPACILNRGNIFSEDYL